MDGSMDPWMDQAISPPLHPKQKTPPPFSLKAVALVGPLGTLAPNLDPVCKRRIQKFVVCAYLTFGN